MSFKIIHDGIWLFIPDVELSIQYWHTLYICIVPQDILDTRVIIYSVEMNMEAHAAVKIAP